jgi:trehalose 2-sulfotransferase
MANAEPLKIEPWLDLSETALDSEAFDQPPPSAPPVRFFILAQRRSGSYMLCRALIRAGLGVPHEYFLKDHMKALAARWSVAAGPRRGPASADYLKALVQRRSRGGFFGAKIQYWQYERTLASPDGDRLLQGARFIYLYREDLMRQAISFRHAEITGRWGSDGRVTTRRLQHADPLDVKAIDRKLNLLIHDEVGWRSFIARRGLKPLRVSYEELCADFTGVMARIADHLGAPRSAVESVAPEPNSEHSGQDPELKRRMMEAYLAAGPRPKAGPWRHPAADALWSLWARYNERRR